MWHEVGNNYVVFVMGLFIFLHILFSTNLEQQLLDVHQFN